ncbi:MAG: HIT domain-containing protein [Planctomycetota bacterium]
MPDSPQNLWAPWRMAYLENLSEPGPDPEAPPPLERGNGCFLCDAARDDLTDQEAHDRLVLRRFPSTVLLLNRYPYANGHLLIAPHQHAAELSELTPQCRAELMETAELATRLLKAACHCQGVNLGLNLGRAAGAGVPGHLHLHAVPRWNGDTNFMQTIPGVRVIPQALEQSHTRLRETLSSMDDV